jgi:phage baseplate assembly protein W
MAEIAVGTSGYADDLQFTATGDLLVLIDTPGNPAASLQRLARIILTNPTIRDAYGNPIGPPDDIFNPTFGSGARELIGQPLTGALVAELQGRIIAAIALDPNFATNPAPAVQVYTNGTNGADGRIYVAVQCSTVSGQIFTLPAMALQLF